MNELIFGLVIVWLGILSWFDIRKNEIPHSAWVIVPLVGACGYRLWQGDGALVVLAVLVAAASERERLSKLCHLEEAGRIITWLPLLLGAAYFAAQNSSVAALGILGFWIAWELKGWGGADAVASITVCLLWPDARFLLAFLVVHLVVVLGLGMVTAIRERKLRLHRLPGLPLLLAAVFLLNSLPFLQWDKLIAG